MLIESIVIGLGIILAAVANALIQGRWHLKPKISDYQVTVLGKTEDAETVQISFPLLKGESFDDWKEKLRIGYEIREERLKFQNERMLRLEEEAKKIREAARDAKIQLVKGTPPETKEPVQN